MRPRSPVGWIGFGPASYRSDRLIPHFRAAQGNRPCTTVDFASPSLAQCFSPPRC
ncbi:hypothetical protein [Lysobacter gummosus]|uniref:hypothetical protein n=1 Tax=Lysobacter gummosus TaxID=262324 RepID=UPI003629CC30